MASGTGQTIDFRMYFAGLSVFTVQRPRVHALLVDARRPGRVQGTENVEPHIPVVQFGWNDALGERRSFGRFDDALGQPRGYWVLDKDVLTLDPAVDTVETGLTLNAAAVQDPTPKRDNADSFEWISPLRDGSGQPGQFKPGLGVAGQRQPGAALAAVVELDRGWVQNAAFAAEQGRFVIVKFASGEERAIASVVKYGATVKGTSVRLVARKFDGTEGERLELVPAKNGENRIEVWVLNREWASIERQQPPRPVVLNRGNPDYLFFHDLIQAPPPPAALPTGVDRVLGEVSPNVSPCHDPAMRRLYFPEGGGETTLAAPCSPARG